MVSAKEQWPKEVIVDETAFVIYTLQPESIEGNTIKAKATVSIKQDDETDLNIGVVWFTGDLRVDTKTDTAYIDEFILEEFRFSKDGVDTSKKMRPLLKQKMKTKNFSILYSYLLTSLKELQVRQKKLNDTKIKAPNILIEDQSSVLVQIQGEPHWIELSSVLKRIENTKSLIVEHIPSKKYYVYIDSQTWYSAAALNGKWAIPSTVPDEVSATAPKMDALLAETSKKQKDAYQKVFIETKPSVLISYTDKPKFTPIEGTELAYLSNTSSDLFIQTTSKTYYVLIFGRWYESKALQGEWKYIASSDLPDDFTNIPSYSSKANVLVSVAGTPESKNSVLKAQVPHTSHINKEAAYVNVTYNGTPKLEPIKGTSMQYIANTAIPVILVDKKYYACDKATWFVSSSPEGEWKAANSVPSVIYTIPPSSHLYNVTFVKIYKSNDDSIWTGYTSGYTGNYVSHTTVVYGTGYFHPVYYETTYYPDRDLGYYTINPNPSAYNNTHGITSSETNNQPTKQQMIDQSPVMEDLNLYDSIEKENNVDVNKNGDVLK